MDSSLWKVNTSYLILNFLTNINPFHCIKYVSAEKWKLHRRLIRPTLSMSSMSEHIDIFNRCIRDSVAALSTSDFVDIFPSMNMCMLTMFLEASLGSDLNQKSKEQYLHHFNE